MCLCFAGGAIDLFYRYGFFSLSVRVVPRDDPGSWLVREPTSRVFDDTSIRRTERPGPNSFAVNPIEVSGKNYFISLKYYHTLQNKFVLLELIKRF